MSDQTLKTLHEAIAAHIKDEGDGDYLTEWVITAAAAIPDEIHATGYYYFDNEIPHHHAVGLLHRALTRLNEPDDED